MYYRENDEIVEGFDGSAITNNKPLVKWVGSILIILYIIIPTFVLHIFKSATEEGRITGTHVGYVLSIIALIVALVLIAK